MSAGSGLPQAEREARQAALAEIGKRLGFNVEAYGKAWTGETADTEFIADAALRGHWDAARRDERERTVAEVVAFAREQAAFATSQVRDDYTRLANRIEARFSPSQTETEEAS